MGDEVWQDLADSLGYTQREVAKFSSCDDPLMMMIGDYKRRGGQANKFIEALYRTGPTGSGLQKARPRGSSSGVVMEEDRPGLLIYVNNNARFLKYILFYTFSFSWL